MEHFLLKVANFTRLTLYDLCVCVVFEQSVKKKIHTYLILPYPFIIGLKIFLHKFTLRSAFVESKKKLDILKKKYEHRSTAMIQASSD